MIENKFPVFSFRLTVTLTVGLGTFQKYFDGFLGFFQDLCEFVRHCRALSHNRLHTGIIQLFDQEILIVIIKTSHKLFSNVTHYCPSTDQIS